MPTFEARVLNFQPLIQTEVTARGSQQPGCVCTAIVDTGSQMTMISSRVARQVGADPAGHVRLAHVGNAQARTDTFMVAIAAPVSPPAAGADGRSIFAMLTSEAIEAAEMPFNPPNFDVIIGMDMLSRLVTTLDAERCVMQS